MQSDAKPVDGQDERPTLDGLMAKVADLSARLDAKDKLHRSLIDEGVAKAVQSVGVVVDYLADRGLLDRHELRRHIERSFLPMTATDDAGDDRLAIDIYGWLIWAEASRYLRTPANLIDEITAPREQGTKREAVPA